jgi:hypothetical protein
MPCSAAMIGLSCADAEAADASAELLSGAACAALFEAVMGAIADP